LMMYSPPKASIVSSALVYIQSLEPLQYALE
jgi:hypothetical protein